MRVQSDEAVVRESNDVESHIRFPTKDSSA